MNKKKYILKKLKRLKKYKKPNSGSSRPHVNAVYLRKDNSRDHELAKFKLGWKHMKAGCDIITEAKTEKGDVIDLVCLDCDEEIEIVKTHEGRQAYIEKGRRLVFLS